MSHSPFFFKCFLLCILKSTFFPRRVPYVNWSYLWVFFLHPEQVLWQFWLKCLSPLQQNFSTSLFEHCWLMLSIAWISFIISFFLFHKVQLSSPTDPLIILLLSLWLRIQHQCSTGGLSGAQKLTFYTHKLITRKQITDWLPLLLKRSWYINIDHGHFGSFFCHYDLKRVCLIINGFSQPLIMIEIKVLYYRSYSLENGPKITNSATVHKLTSTTVYKQITIPSVLFTH